MKLSLSMFRINIGYIVITFVIVVLMILWYKKIESIESSINNLKNNDKSILSRLIDVEILFKNSEPTEDLGTEGLETEVSETEVLENENGGVTQCVDIDSDVEEEFSNENILSTMSVDHISESDVIENKVEEIESSGVKESNDEVVSLEETTGSLGEVESKEDSEEDSEILKNFMQEEVKKKKGRGKKK